MHSSPTANILRVPAQVSLGLSPHQLPMERPEFPEQNSASSGKEARPLKPKDSRVQRSEGWRAWVPLCWWLAVSPPDKAKPRVSLLECYPSGGAFPTPSPSSVHRPAPRGTVEARSCGTTQLTIYQHHTEIRCMVHSFHTGKTKEPLPDRTMLSKSS